MIVSSYGVQRKTTTTPEVAVFLWFERSSDRPNLLKLAARFPWQLNQPRFAVLRL